MENNLKGKRLLILGGSDLHVKVVNTAKELGVYTIVTSYNKIELDPAKQIADEYWMLDIKDINAIVSRAKESKIDGVLAYCINSAQKPYQEICEKLDLPCYGTKEQFELMNDKKLFKQFCKKNGLDIIPSYSVSDVLEGNVEFPLLIKPVDGRGSRGQTVIYNKTELQNAIDIALVESDSNDIIIEKFLTDAQDMSFAYMVINKIPYLIKIGDRYLGNKEDNLSQQQMATVLPSRYTDNYIAKIEPQIKKMITNLGLDFGPIFLQGLYKDDKVFMYDPALRLPGTDFDLMIRDVTGFDNIKMLIDFAITGRINRNYGSIENVYNYNGEICLLFSISVKPGQIAIYEGFDIISKKDFVVSAFKLAKEGDVIPATGDIRQRVADFVLRIPNKELIMDTINYIYKTICIKDNNGNDMIVSRIEQIYD